MKKVRATILFAMNAQKNVIYGLMMIDDLTKEHRKAKTCLIRTLNYNKISLEASMLALIDLTIETFISKGFSPNDCRTIICDTIENNKELFEKYKLGN
jgi:hypothetical protein